MVPLPSSGPSPVVITGACVAMGLGLFVFLEGRRQQAHAAAAPPAVELASTGPIQTIPALDLPAAAPAPAAPEPKRMARLVIVQPAPPLVQETLPTGSPPAGPPVAPGQLQEPALVIDLTEAPEASKATDQAHAVVMRHKAMIVPQGTTIPAVLETPINSAAPGLVRAITARDVSGFDGSRVLIPKGSRLFGDYPSNIQPGQSRVLVTWTTLVRPDGVAIKLGSPAADANGGFGIPGRVNNHTLARVGSALLQSALAVGVNLAYRPAAGAVVIGAPIQAATTAGGALIPDAQAGPTITVKEGADISVLVARDLDFSGALPRG
jgi:type IV secretion system protein VirB10